MEIEMFELKRLGFVLVQYVLYGGIIDMHAMYLHNIRHLTGIKEA